MAAWLDHGDVAEAIVSSSIATHTGSNRNAVDRSTLASAILAKAVRVYAAARPRRLSVLIFHRVHAERDPLYPSEPDVLRFEHLMCLVRDCFHVMPLAEAVTALRRGTLPSRALAITFDDGYADNAAVALPILSRLALPATFFIATAYLDGGRMFNDTVIEAVRAFDGDMLDLQSLGLGCHPTRSLPEKRAAIDVLISTVKHLQHDARETKVAEIAAAVRRSLPDDLMLSSLQLKQLGDAGMEIGGHTQSHPILTLTTAQEAEREIGAGKERLEAILGKCVRLFAYPNGKPGQDYDATHVALVKRLGFHAAVSTAWGVAATDSDLYQIPRFTPWDAEPWKFCVRLAGNLGRTDYARV